MKQKGFYAYAEGHGYLPLPLLKATVRQFGGWGAFEGCARDVANYGIDGGYGGFIYHADTVAFFVKHRTDIRAAVAGLADSLGEPVLTVLQTFGCLKGVYSDDALGELYYNPGADHWEGPHLANALAWFAGEEAARLYADWVYEAKGAA